MRTHSSGEIARSVMIVKETELRNIKIGIKWKAVLHGRCFAVGGNLIELNTNINRELSIARREVTDGIFEHMLTGEL